MTHDISDEVLLQVVLAVAPTLTRSVYDLLDLFPIFAQFFLQSEIPSEVQLGSTNDLRVRAIGGCSKLLSLMSTETAARLGKVTLLLDFTQLLVLNSLSHFTQKF